ncbi:2Fe-2S iron-sulfur cluster-binding protein [Rhodoferax sp.]|uniref:2Fe-2S iron-sulfur cluster-binding protein n=1 Tax=Rhodoferax sp. TaxID=50421 RepID=UPI0027649D44|nr:2Fe-2S iron-sulfur cluster-binding protein [Rhodoferax sp.]
MTAPLLLAYICAALLLQLALGLGFVLWRRHATVVPGTDGLHAQPVAAGAWPGWREFRVIRREYEDTSRTQCSFYLAAMDGAPLPTFQPGQFLSFALEVADAAEPGGRRSIIRCYSLSDRPDPKHYRVTIKRVPAPLERPGVAPGLSSGYFHDAVKEGAVLKVKAPAGHFHLDRQSMVPVVLIGGGIGITPVMSMLRWCLAEQPQRTVHLYYGLRNSKEHAFKQQLEQLAAKHARFHLDVVYSRPDPNDAAGRDYQHAGHVDLDLLRRSLPHGRHQFYVCGPAPMMENLVPALAQWGVAMEDIHFEAFGPASVRLPGVAPAPAAAAAVSAVGVHFRRSGRTLVWSGQDANLLDFAERHGVAVNSGCRSGGCGSCQTRVVSGSVHYANRPDHDVAAGHCLLCVGTPISALELEA